MKKIIRRVFIIVLLPSAAFAGWFDYTANTIDTFRVCIDRYSTIQTTANDFGADGQLTGTDYLSLNNTYRIRQDGVLNKVKFFSAAISTEFRIKVWRYNGSTYDLVGQSEDISGSVNSLTTHTITLSNAITVKQGDYVGFKLHVNDNVLTSKSAVTTTYKIDGLSSTENVDFENGSTVTGVVPIEVYLTKSPIFCIVGSSIGAGHPDNFSLVESSRYDDFTNTIPGQLAAKIFLERNVTYSYQNLGVGSAITSQIALNNRYYAIPAKPKFILLQGGGNNIALSGTKTEFIADYTDMLDRCAAANIRPIILLMFPKTSYTNEQMQTRDDWNASIVTLAENYPSLKPLVVNSDSYVGEFRDGGADGNLWDIQSAYDYDGIHFTAAGNAKIAEAIYDAMLLDESLTVKRKVSIGGLLKIDGLTLDIQ